MAKHVLKPVRNTRNKMKLMVPIMVAGVLFSSSGAAMADTGTHNLNASVSSVALKNATALKSAPLIANEVISAPSNVKISFAQPVVKSTPKPKPVVKPVVEAAKEAPVGTAPVTTTTDAQAPAVAGTPANIPAGEATPNLPANGSAATSIASNGATDAFGAQIAAAAIAQVNAHIEEDCTMLVTNSLKTVGIDFHDWPVGYLSLGSITTNPQPGDLIYYKNGGGAEGLAHIAVYLGNGLAAHGGWEGHSTKIWSVNVGSGPIYIHVNR